VSESLKVPARVWRDAFAGLMEDDFTAQLNAIKAPTLLLWGDRDAMVPRGDQYAVLGALPTATLSVYEGTGHAVHWEQPARFARDLAASDVGDAPLFPPYTLARRQITVVM
jgi:non-heme chloroperoxidase